MSVDARSDARFDGGGLGANRPRSRAIKRSVAAASASFGGVVVATAGDGALGALFDTRAAAFGPFAVRVVLELRDFDAFAGSLERCTVPAADAVAGADAVDGAPGAASFATGSADSLAKSFSDDSAALRDSVSVLSRVTAEGEFALTSAVLAVAPFATPSVRTPTL